jgi:hypothetical protein
LPTVKVDRPNRIGGTAPPSSSGVIYGFNPAAFAPQAIGTAGNAGRNQVYGPHMRRTDLSLFRTFPIHEQLRAEFRAECFNISNTANYAQPGNQVASWVNGAGSTAGNFGIITSTATGTTGRQFQFAMKLLF